MATLGDLRSGFITVFVGYVMGRRRWKLCIDEFFDDPGSAPSAGIIYPEKDLRLYYGKSRNDLWSGSIASSLRLRFFDPSGGLFSRLLAARLAGEDDTKFRARIRSTDGLYSWEGWLRLDTTDQALSSKTGRRITEVYCYDGLAEPGSIPTLAGEEGECFHGTARNVLSYSIAPLDIRYLMEFTGTNIGAGAITSHLDVSPRRASFVLPVPLTRAEAFEESIRYLLCRAWQGMNATWYVAQPWMMGRNLSAGEGGEVFSYVPYDAGADVQSEVTSADIVSRSFTLRETLSERKAKRRIYSLIASYELERSTSRDWLESQFQQNYQFTKWDGDTFRYGSQTGDITFDNRGQFSSSMEFGPSAEWENERHIFDAGEEVYFEVNFVWMAERDGGSGDKHFEFEIMIEATEPGDSDRYLQSDGTWIAATVTLTTSDETPDANGSPALTEHETTVQSIEPIPVRGRLKVLWRNPDANDRLFLTRYWIRPITAGGDALNNLSWTATIRRLDGSGEARAGDTLRRESKVINLGQQAALLSDGGVNVFNDTLGDFEQLSRWVRLSDPAVSYADMMELQGSIILSDETARLREIEGPMRGIHPPEDVPVFECVPYVWLEGFIDLIPEITEARYAEKPFSYD